METNKKTIKITCKAQKYLSIDKLRYFQGGLKELSSDDKIKLKRSIIKHGFAFPVFVWKNYILDGHQRVFVVSEMIKEGYRIGEIPVNEIFAKNKKDAAEKLLIASSRYGKITVAGLENYCIDFNIDIKKLEEIDLPEINLNKIGKEIENNRIVIEELYQILIDCVDEDQQISLLQKLEKENIKCRALIS